MVKPITRRMRCSVQSCKNMAEFGIGIKGLDYPMCREHFTQLVDEGTAMLNPIPEVIPEPVEEVVEVEVVEKLAEEPAAEPVNEVPEVKEKPEDFYVCKYCGEKFNKKEYTPAQFAIHVKACKKEHSK